MHVSLIDGWLPVAIAVVNAGLLLTVTLEALRRSRFARPALVSATVTVTIALGYETFGSDDFRFPNAFYLWLGTIVLATALAIAIWRTVARSRQLLLVSTIGFAAITTCTVVNAHYGYFPNAAALLGEVGQHELTPSELDSVIRKTSQSGILPAHGYIVRSHIPGKISGFVARDAYVYLPPVWFTTPTPELPLIEMLHGVPGGPEDWIRAGGSERTANKYASTHHGWAPILVFPDTNGSWLGDTECVDRVGKRAETYLTQDVPQFMATTYGASQRAGHRAIVGLSAGGTCAITLTLRNPDKYRAFVDFGGDLQPTLGTRRETLHALYDGDQSQWLAHDPTTLLATRELDHLTGWFEVGSADYKPRIAAETLHGLAKDAGMQTTLVIRPGGHNFKLWRKALISVFDWLSQTIA